MKLSLFTCYCIHINDIYVKKIFDLITFLHNCTNKSLTNPFVWKDGGTTAPNIPVTKLICTYILYTLPYKTFTSLKVLFLSAVITLELLLSLGNTIIFKQLYHKLDTFILVLRCSFNVESQPAFIQLFSYIDYKTWQSLTKCSSRIHY